MTKPDLDKIEARAEAAGNWVSDGCNIFDGPVELNNWLFEGLSATRADVNLVINAPADIFALVKELRAARRVIEATRTLEPECREWACTLDDALTAYDSLFSDKGGKDE